MDINLFFNILTVLEIIAVEFVSIWNFSKKKHSFAVSLGIYIAITIILMIFMCLVAVHLPGYGNGNGRFMALGAFYFIPALANYGGDWKSRIIIAFYSFSYGLAGFVLAVRIGYLFDKSYLSMTVLIAQTLLYAVSFSTYLRVSKTQIVVYLKKANSFQKNLLIRHTIVSFILIIVYNNIMVMDASMVKKFVVYVLLIYFIVLTYRLCLSYLKADDDKNEQTELARTDRLTGLGNRTALRGRLEELMENKKSFYLLFLDLNHFKTINDHHGHATGDFYLYKFAEILRECSKEENSCFRFAGDEFICLTTDEALCKTIQSLEIDKLGEAKYLGVSVGMARYPEDADTISGLLKLADQRMYEQKITR